MLSRLFKWLSVLWFRISGWKIPKAFPTGIRQYVLVVAPHTSNIDFFVGVAARKILKLKVKFIAKKELFKFPIKNLLLNLGGFPVDRNVKGSMVDQMVHNFKLIDDFAITLTPEGTRGKVEKWKTGFYHISLNANVPIVMVGFDYDRKEVIISEAFYPSGNMENDFVEMHKFFANIIPKYPEQSQYKQ